jgi:hypothetical protein
MQPSKKNTLCYLRIHSYDIGFAQDSSKIHSRGGIKPRNYFLLFPSLPSPPSSTRAGQGCKLGGFCKLGLYGSKGKGKGKGTIYINPKLLHIESLQIPWGNSKWYCVHVYFAYNCGLGSMQTKREALWKPPPQLHNSCGISFFSGTWRDLQWTQPQ